VPADTPVESDVSAPDANGEAETVAANHAAIDIGTNSVHLVVARLDPGGKLRVKAREKEMVRLGEGPSHMRWLGEEAMDRALDALGRMGRIADSYDADLRAVATSAVREAENRMTFVRRAQVEAGIEVEIISGVEEARLIHLGVLQGVEVFDQRVLVIDIGGGSTELVVGLGATAELLRSLRLGAIRLTERFFPDGVVAPGSEAEARRWLRSELEPVVREFRGRRPEVVVGSSGTIETVAKMAGALDDSSVPSSVINTRVTAHSIRRVASLITSFEQPEDRAQIPGLDPKRVDIITGGAVLLASLVDALGIEELVVSGAALREGVLLDSARNATSGDLRHLSDLRQSSLLRFGEHFGEDPEHVGHATDLSLKLFDATWQAHRADDAGRNLLEAAGLVHNVGLFVSHAAHHKHSYYVVRNTDMLAGFNEQELELMALVARYHRKRHPQPSHNEFARLDAADQDTVRLLAGLLRLGIALDRTRARLVTGMKVDLTEERLVIHPRLARGADAGVEIYAAQDRSGLLAEALGRPVEIAAPD